MQENAEEYKARKVGIYGLYNNKDGGDGYSK